MQFVVRRDPDAYFQFASLGSAAAERSLSGAPAPGRLPDSIVLVEDGRVFTQSGAALRIARRLTFPWPLTYAFIIIPRPLRDWVYAFIARHRYRWFGRRETCMIPGPRLRDRFL